jgi:hypothetical protein
MLTSSEALGCYELESLTHGLIYLLFGLAWTDTLNQSQTGGKSFRQDRNSASAKQKVGMSETKSRHERDKNFGMSLTKVGMSVTKNSACIHFANAESNPV